MCWTTCTGASTSSSTADPTEIGLESTIVDFTVEPPALRRPGGLTLEQIRVVIPEVQPIAARTAADQPQLAPGQMARHYAPRADPHLV